MNKFFTPFVVFTMYFTGGLIPRYILITQWLHMGNTIWAVVIPGAISTFNLLLMKSLRPVPEELGGSGVHRRTWRLWNIC